jgi:hypothetical protein
MGLRNKSAYIIKGCVKGPVACKNSWNILDRLSWNFLIWKFVDIFDFCMYFFDFLLCPLGVVAWLHQFLLSILSISWVKMVQIDIFGPADSIYKKHKGSCGVIKSHFHRRQHANYAEWWSQQHPKIRNSALFKRKNNAVHAKTTFICKIRE